MPGLPPLGHSAERESYEMPSMYRNELTQSILENPETSEELNEKLDNFNNKLDPNTNEMLRERVIDFEEYEVPADVLKSPEYTQYLSEVSQVYMVMLHNKDDVETVEKFIDFCTNQEADFDDLKDIFGDKYSEETYEDIYEATNYIKRYAPELLENDDNKPEQSESDENEEEVSEPIQVPVTNDIPRTPSQVEELTETPEETETDDSSDSSEDDSSMTEEPDKTGTIEEQLEIPVDEEEPDVAEETLETPAETGVDVQEQQDSFENAMFTDEEIASLMSSVELSTAAAFGPYSGRPVPEIPSPSDPAYEQKMAVFLNFIKEEKIAMEKVNKEEKQ